MLFDLLPAQTPVAGAAYVNPSMAGPMLIYSVGRFEEEPGILYSPITFKQGGCIEFEILHFRRLMDSRFKLATDIPVENPTVLSS